MKLENYAAKIALEEKNYRLLAELICQHFKIQTPYFDIRDECGSMAPTRAVLLVIEDKKSYCFKFAKSYQDQDSYFISWGWSASYPDDRNYLLITNETN